MDEGNAGHNVPKVIVSIYFEIDLYCFLVIIVPWELNIDYDI